MRVRAAVLAAVGLALSCGGDRVRQLEPEFVPPPELVEFGAVPVLNERVVKVPLQNVGRATFQVLQATIQDEGTPFRVKAGVSEVEPAQTAELELAFVPPAEVEYQATLVIETDDDAHPRVEVKLTGQGSTRAIAAVEPSELAFGRVGECSAAVQTFKVRSQGSADLIVEEIAFVEGTSPAFSFVGSTKTPAVVKTVGDNGLPGEVQLTVKYTVEQGAEPASGAVRLVTTDPDLRVILIPLSGEPNRAPTPAIAPFGNGAPGMTVTLDGTGSSDPDGDAPLSYQWTLRRKPLGTQTQIVDPNAATTSMQLDPAVPGEYEVELNVTDSTGVKSCQPLRSTVVAAPAQKLLVELFWSHPKTDIDLHVLRVPNAPVGSPPDDCFYGNPNPDWGTPSDATDDPEFLRDALTGYGPEVFGYVNPVDGTYRIVAEHAHDHLDPNPATEVTVRIYQFGVVKGEFKRTLTQMGALWSVADLEWPSGAITPLP